MTKTHDDVLTGLDPDRLAPSKANPSVREVMRNEVVYCLPSTPIDAVAKLLADNELDELPMIIDHQIVGYVTARDILQRLAANEISLAGSDFAVRAPVTEVMAADLLRSPALLVDEKQLLGDVVATLQQQQRAVAVVMHEDEIPVGLITAKEVIAFTAEAVHGENR